MLPLAKLAHGSEGSYIIEAVARGAEDYYVGRGEAPATLRAILNGRAAEGAMLGATNRTVPGFADTLPRR